MIKKLRSSNIYRIVIVLELHFETSGILVLLLFIYFLNLPFERLFVKYFILLF